MADENEQAEGGDAAGAEWSEMLDENAATEGEDPARILNQDEIDSLLGFETAVGEQHTLSGIHAILDKSRMAYEKLPMMEVVAKLILC